MKHRTLRLVVILAGAIALMIMAESAARYYVVRKSDNSPVSDAYQDSSYYSPAFVAESARASGVEWQLNVPYALNANMTGRWINIVNHWRVTTDQPPRYRHTIWIVGNSALYNRYVPDNMTIASYLQRLIPAYRVEQRAAPGWTVTQEAIATKRLPLAPGDIVVWIDGLPDIGASLTYSVADSQPCRTLLQRFSWSQAVHMACDWIDVPVIKPSSQWHDAVLQAAVGYRQNILSGQQTARNAGATFYHFVEPYQFNDPSTSQEYNVFSDSVANISGADLSHVVPSRDFISGWHFNEHGSAAVARSIYAAIWQRF